MPELPISQQTTANFRPNLSSMWDEYADNCDEEAYNDYLSNPCLEDGPLNDSQVKALLAAQPVPFEGSRGTATPIRPTSETSSGGGETTSPSETPSDFSACPGLIASSDIENVASVNPGNRKRMRCKGKAQGYYIAKNNTSWRLRELAREEEVETRIGFDTFESAPDRGRMRSFYMTAPGGY